MRQGTENVGMKRLVRLDIRNLYAQQVLDGARDGVAFHDFRSASDGALEGLKAFLGVIGKAYGDVNHKASPQAGSIDNGPVSGDDTGRFQVLYPPQASRGGQTDPFSQFHIGLARVLCKLGQYSFVNSI